MCTRYLHKAPVSQCWLSHLACNMLQLSLIDQLEDSLCCWVWVFRFSDKRLSRSNLCSSCLYRHCLYPLKEFISSLSKKTEEALWLSYFFFSHQYWVWENIEGSWTRHGGSWQALDGMSCYIAWWAWTATTSYYLSGYNMVWWVWASTTSTTCAGTTWYGGYEQGAGAEPQAPRRSLSLAPSSNPRRFPLCW